MRLASGKGRPIARAVETDGFGIVEHVLTPTQERELADAIQDCDNSTVSHPNGGVYAMRNLLDVGAVRQVARSEEVLALARPILGAGAFPVRGLYFDKRREANWKVPWHQDISVAVRHRRDAPGFGPWSVKAGVVHVQPPLSVLKRMLTVRLHLDKCDSEHGPLRVLPGSHECGVLKADEIRQFRATTEEAHCLVGRGGAVVMRPLLLHASSEATGAGHRRVVHLEYAAEQLPGGIEWREPGMLTGS